MENKILNEGMSQLRQDPVSGNWVVIAVARGKRPHAFAGKAATFEQPRAECPFEKPFNEEHPPLLRYDRTMSAGDREWAVAAIPNKFPAFTKGTCNVSFSEGPYTFTNGSGSHELFILRDHDRFIPDLTPEEASLLVEAYAERYRFVSKQECVDYVLIFHNHGKEAGASIAHPHSQLIATPVVPPDVRASVEASERYFKEHGTCVHCNVIAYEHDDQKRVVYENEKFIVVAPYASRIPFELRIYPKAHESDFGNISKQDVPFIASALQEALKSLRIALGDPAYNFFIHTAPSFQRNSPHYHWHWEIIPKTAVWAGFEISTGMYICSLPPEDAAAFLKEALAKK